MLHSATFWLVVSMLMFLALVGKPAGKAIAKGLDARRDAVRHELAKAERLRAEAEELLSKYQQQLLDALQEAETILSDAKEDAGRMREEAALLLKNVLAAKEAEAMARIAEAEENATREARQMAANIAISATRILLSERLKGDAAEQLVDNAIAHLPQKLAS